MRKTPNLSTRAHDIDRTCDALERLEPLFRAFDVTFAYVFGSYGQYLGGGPKPGPLSDVDVAVAMGDEGRFDKLCAEITNTLQRDDVDLVLLRPILSPLLRKRIMTEGHCVFSANEQARLNALTRAVDEYLDTRHLRDVQNAYLERRIKGGLYGR